MKKTNSKNPPRLHLTEKELPEVKTWKVGQKYYLIVEVEMTAVRKEVDYANSPMDMMARGDAPKIISGDFEIRGVSVDTDYHTEYARRMGTRKG